MPIRLLGWAEACSVLCYPPSSPLAPRGITFPWEHGETVCVMSERITCVGPFPLSS